MNLRVRGEQDREQCDGEVEGRTWRDPSRLIQLDSGLGPGPG